jgi:hypothetical protein
MSQQRGFSVIKKSHRLSRSVSPVIEQLERRQLMSATVDIRVASGGGQAVTATSVGQVVNLEVWVTVTGADADGSNDGVQVITGSVLSSNISGGSTLGTLSLHPVSPFNASGSSAAAQADLDGDGDLDAGSNVSSDSTGMLAARSASMTTGTDGTINGASNSFKVAVGTFTVTSLLSGSQTNLTFRPRSDQPFSFVVQEDGATKNGTNGGTLTAGQSVVIKREGTGKISGRVFNDKNANGIFDGDDAGISGFRVFLDENFNGVLDNGEVSKPVSTTGTYTFSNVVTGTYRVREVFRDGWRQSFPALGYYQVTMGYGDTAKTQSFANTDTIVIKGKVWLDANKNHAIDAGEPGLAGWYVYIDHNSNGVFDKGDDWSLSDVNGNYRFFNLPAGTYQVRINQLPKYTQTSPAAGFHTLVLAAGQTTSNKNFGEKKIK